MAALDIARENATLREEFLRRGLTTEAELDRVGWVSHATLDLWEQAGVIELGVRGLEEAWGLGMLHGDLFNRRVLRGRGGRFAGTMGGVDPGKQSNRRMARNRTGRVREIESRATAGEQPIRTLKIARGAGRGKRFNVYPTPPAPGPHERIGQSTIPERMTHRQYAAERPDPLKVENAGSKRLNRLASQHRRAARDGTPAKEGKKADASREKAATAAASGQHIDAAEHYVAAGEHAKAAEHYAEALRHRDQIQKAGETELYEKRTTKLEKRIKRGVKKAGEKVTPAAGQARGEHDLSAAERHFNDAGKVSQKTLLAYAEDAATRPTTAQMYRDKDGNYHPSRQQLHEHIIDMMLRQHATTTVTKDGQQVEVDGGLSSDAPELKAPSGAPTVVFTGGGYASGKGGVIRMLHDNGTWPPDAVQLDPDLIKAQLPEFQATAMDDPEANLRVYTEAWDIAQAVMKRAQEKGLNVVVDGITDTSADDVAKRVKTFTDAGYENPRIMYVSVPTNTAIQRAKDRAAGAKTMADRRMIPEVIMRSVHRDVSATIPNVVKNAKDMGAHVEVYSTDVPKGQSPILTAVADPVEGTHFPNRTEYQRIVNKANETIEGVPGVEGPERGAWKTGGQIVSIDPTTERRLGQAIMNALPEGIENGPKRQQPTGDPEKLLAMANEPGLHDYQTLLDLGAGIAQALGAQVQDISAGKDFGQVGQDIQANMDKPHVIIAPVKGRKRAAEKMKADGTANDWSYLHDALRATVTVPEAQDIPHALSVVQQELEKQGWTMERGKARLVNAKGKNRMPGNGYGDTTVYVRNSKTGMIAELQINTNPMWWSKEIGPGHQYYELERSLRGRATSEERSLTDPEKALVKKIAAAAEPIYDRAWGASLNGGIRSDPAAVVMGDQADRAASAKSLADLTQQTEAMMAAQEAPIAKAA